MLLSRSLNWFANSQGADVLPSLGMDSILTLARELAGYPDYPST